MQRERPRLAVLLSGRGSNFLALAEACAAGRVPAEIVLVASNVEGAGGLQAATERGLHAVAIPHRGLGRDQHEALVLRELAQAGAEWICLAGYMRLLSPAFVGRYPERIVNIHPSLLPAFPGLNVHEQVIRHGARVSGCTVHLVDAGLDSGPIVVQRAVPVADDDDPESLAARVLREEHAAYPEAMRRLLTEAWRVEGRRLVFGAHSGESSPAEKVSPGG